MISVSCDTGYHERCKGCDDCGCHDEQRRAEQREAFRKMDALATQGDSREYREAFAEWAATHGMRALSTDVPTKECDDCDCHER